MADMMSVSNTIERELRVQLKEAHDKLRDCCSQLGHQPVQYTMGHKYCTRCGDWICEHMT
jgi:hypothetical protein